MLYETLQQVFVNAVVTPYEVRHEVGYDKCRSGAVWGAIILNFWLCQGDAV